MKKVYFLFGIHNHQPVGNFPEVLEKAYRDAYAPFLEAMKRHPLIKWSLHASGPLWEFIFERHPEYVEAVRAMVRSGQVELMSGGYYEPIMPAVPDSDKEGQIRKLTAFIEKEFRYTPKGMWLAERVWEPHLARALAGAGVEYTVVDDAHFAAAGLDVEQLRGYYVTEEQGVNLSIFPISQRLRYTIPFLPVETTIEYLSSCARDDSSPALVMADDGEKFGLWPETYKHVYHDGWLENFLAAIERNSDWIIPATFSEYRARVPAEGRVYLPTASYFEMSEWSLPEEAQEEFEGIVRQFDSRPDIKRFLRGGFWRNFLTKYPEANNLHKKMLYVSGRVNALKGLRGKKSGAAAKKKIEAALDHLYAGECNCAFWHGVFGGLYLPHLRSALYRELLAAEELARTLASPKEEGWRLLDFDGDGREELLFEGKRHNLYFSPHCGGTLFEWDVMDRKVNLLNVLTRRKEAYHKRLIEYLSRPPQAVREIKTIHDLIKVKEENLEHYLHYDWHRRVSFVDHFLHPDTTLDHFKSGKYGEQGDFALGSYHAAASGRTITLTREGTVWSGQSAFPVGVTKEITPTPAGFNAVYEIRNPGEHAVRLHFAPEFNYAFSFGIEGENGEFKGRREWSRRDECFALSLRMAFSAEVDLWVFPLETVSLSEGGFERTYQGTVVLPVHTLSLPARSSKKMSIFAEVKGR